MFAYSLLQGILRRKLQHENVLNRIKPSARDTPKDIKSCSKVRTWKEHSDSTRQESGGKTRIRKLIKNVRELYLLIANREGEERSREHSQRRGRDGDKKASKHSRIASSLEGQEADQRGHSNTCNRGILEEDS